ncbi:META domain-containing protein [Candidatus Competibacter phosphatis]|uniref:META domain-containing protein n=1 Tax=Candidatus Competibacter phosphatis TaxID=221280 RepID=UPI0028B01B7B|nr:META domain-containing protein [Candidatus Competibacter phosphatis]
MHHASAADGRVELRADCNRGQGSWSEPAPGQLRFGRLVTTRVMCPSKSLSDRFIRGLGDVRSYLFRGGRLYLSLMADGGVYEFEPMPR